MNCQDAGFWRSYIDNDSPLSGERKKAAETHLAGCGDCRALMEELSTVKRMTGTALTVGGGEPGAAWAGLAREIEQPGRRRRISLSWKPALGLALAVAFAAVVAAPPVRSIAADFLQLFRAEKFEAIKIDPQAMANFDPRKLGKFTFNQPQPQPVDTVQAAAGITGLDVKEPGNLPAGLKRAHMEAGGAGSVSLTVDLKKFTQYLSENKIEGVNLPPELDGKTITGHIPPVVTMNYGGELVVAQAGLPTLEAPPGLDAGSIRDELLKLPVFPPQVREQLQAMTDWKRTLPIPYPADAASSEPVKLGGHDGLYFTASGGTKVLMWTENDQAFGLVAPENSALSRDEIFSIADSLK